MTKEEIVQLQLGDDLFVDKGALISYSEIFFEEKLSRSIVTELCRCNDSKIRCIFLQAHGFRKLKIILWDKRIKSSAVAVVDITDVS